MKLLSNLLIFAFLIKCFFALGTNDASIYDGIFLVAALTYFAVKLDIALPQDSK